MTLLRPCELCGAPPERQTRTWPDARIGSASYGYMTCGECGLVFCNPLPNSSDQAAFHRDQYAADADAEPERVHKMDPEQSRQRLYSPAYQRWAKGLLERLASHVPPELNGPIRFLEVGCASGGILKAARDLGMRPVGVEVSPEAAAYGLRQEKLDIRIGLLEQLGLLAGSFDMVLLHDVVEHVPSPMNLLRECVRLLSPGGVLCVHTVNVESATAKRAGRHFYLADVTGGHLVLFSPGTLKRYGGALGLEILALETRGFRLVQRESDRRQMGWMRPFIRLAENLGHELVKWTNRGHFVLLIARKP